MLPPMRRPGSRLLRVARAGVVMTASCAGGGDDGSGHGVRVSVTPSLVAPLSVLDDAQTVAVYVFDATSATCDPTTGLAMNGGQRLDLTTATGQTDLSSSGCMVEGARFCGT